MVNIQDSQRKSLNYGAREMPYDEQTLCFRLKNLFKLRDYASKEDIKREFDLLYNTL